MGQVRVHRGHQEDPDQDRQDEHRQPRPLLRHLITLRRTLTRPKNVTASTSPVYRAAHPPFPRGFFVFPSFERPGGWPYRDTPPGAPLFVAPYTTPRCMTTLVLINLLILYFK